MPDLYEFVEECKERGLTADEAEREYSEYIEEKKRSFMEAYENDPYVQYGWHQQDIIDSYRRER